MRRIIAFLGSISLNGGVIFGILYWLDVLEEKTRTVVTEAVHFDLGMMVAANPLQKQPSRQSQTRQARRSIESASEPESVLEPETIIEPMEKPVPVVKKAERKIKKRIVKTVEKRKPERSHKKRAPKTSRKKPPKNTQRQIARKVSVGIGVQPINTVENRGKSPASQGGKGASKQSRKSDTNTYRAGLQRAIKRIADKTARHMRKQGKVRVRFNLGRDGRISHVACVGSSGDRALDKAATKVLIRLGRYRAPPPDFPGILTVPIILRPR